MIAFVLRETGRDPAWLIGGAGAAARLERRRRRRVARRRRRRVRPDRLRACRPTIAVVTNVELDHHTEFASLAELEAAFAAWLADARVVVATQPAVRGRARASRRAQPPQRRHGARRARARPASRGPRPSRRSRGSPGRAAASRSHSRPATFAIVDDYAHHPSEIAATIAAARERFPGATVRVLFQPHLYSRTRHLADELAAALAGADDVTVTDVYPAREAPIAGVTGKLVVDRSPIAACSPAGCRRSRRAPARLRRRAQPGDVLLVLGAGDVDRAVGLLAG